MGRQKRGSVMVLVVFVVVLLLLLGTAVLSLGLNARTYVARNASEVAARCAADAGVARAIYLMNSKLTATKEAGEKWDNSTLPSETDIALPNCSSTYSFKITGDPLHGFGITSTGKCRGTEKTVHGSLIVKSLWSGIGVIEDIYLANNVQLGTYPPGGDFTIWTNSIIPGSVYIRNNVTVPGDVIIGPGGNPSIGEPDSVIVLENSAVITGQTVAAPEPFILQPAQPPLDLPNKGGLNISGDDIVTITQDCQYSAIRMSNQAQLRIASGGNSEANPKVRIYVTGRIEMQNQSKLVLEPGVSLIIYLGGDLIVRNYAKVNADITNPNDSTKLRIYGTQSCTKISLQQNTSFYGGVYAPNAILQLNNSEALYGAFVGRRLRMGNISSIYHYVTLFAIVDIDDETAAHFELLRWW